MNEWMKQNNKLTKEINILKTNQMKKIGGC